MRQSDSVTPVERVQDQRSVPPAFRPDIEGLRAVAVLGVLLFHAEVPGVDGGFAGVDVFFVISGFLITGLLWREVSTAGTVRLRRFYGARARRLLPASATVGVITAITAALLLPPLEARSVLMDGIASAFYISNYWFIGQQVDYFGGNRLPSPFQHYWSLGVEEQFYLVWPALIIVTAWLIRRVRRRAKADAAPSKRPYLVVLALVAIVSFALSLMITFIMPLAAFFSLPTRAWQLAVGGLVALTAGQWRRLSPRAAVIVGWGGLALILAAYTQLGPTTLYPGTAAVLPVLGAALVIGAGCAAPVRGCGGFLAWSPMGAIGRVSYSWYLWHWPVLVFAPVLLGHPLGLVDRLVAVLVSGALAVLTLRFIENPVRFATRVRRSPVASLAVGGVATSVAGSVGAVLLVWVSSLPVPIPIGRGAPAAAFRITSAPVPTGGSVAAYEAAVQDVFGQVQAAVAASAELKDVPANLDPPLADVASELQAMLFGGCLRLPFQGGQPECVMGDTASQTTVALVGDSHAGMWIPAFRQIATQRPWRVETLAKMACPLMDLPTTNPLFSRLVEYLDRCGQWRAHIIERLRAEHPRLVVVSLFRGYTATDSRGWLAGFTSYDPAWIASLTDLVQQLRDTGAKVLVLGPIPHLSTSVPGCLSHHLDDATVCSTPRSTAFNQSGMAAESAAVKAGGGEYADLTDLFCTPNRCPTIVGNTLVYVDAGHLTLEYSQLLAPAIGALADRALAQR